VRRRFFVEQFEGNSATMQGDAAHHLGNVLRAQPGQIYELSDGQRVCLGRVERVSRDRVEFALVEEIPGYQPRVDVTLLLAVVKFDAFEWAIEKATELGVSTIVPLAAARSDKAHVAAAGKRAERWRKLLAEASQQSRRVKVPALQDAARPAEVFPKQSAAIKVVLSERPEAPALRKLLSGATAPSAALAIGPEGGWTDEEFALAPKAGFREASLGKLILRTETAVIAALASINYALGD
jgi:16S rRNA (uracil1498-N3)-methyltransferase